MYLSHTCLSNPLRWACVLGPRLRRVRGKSFLAKAGQLGRYLVCWSHPGPLTSYSPAWACANAFSPGPCCCYCLNLHLLWDVKIVCYLHLRDDTPFWEFCVFRPYFCYGYWHLRILMCYDECWSGTNLGVSQALRVCELTHLLCKCVLRRGQVPSWARWPFPTPLCVWSVVWSIVLRIWRKLRSDLERGQCGVCAGGQSRNRSWWRSQDPHIL